MTNQALQGGGALPDGDRQAVAEFREMAGRVREELGKVIIGQHEVINQLLVALFAGGHCMLEGVPGLAKTLMISSLAECLHLGFRRIQFTPDLMPSDITGTEVIQEDRATGGRALRFLPGPIFANVILADEINRTPPKTQAALLEAMQEKHVTVGGVRHDLTPPFFVLATQNPIEQEGTYPLPEAQQDRFMFKVAVGYQSYQEECLIAERTTDDEQPTITAVIGASDILAAQRLIRRIPISESMIRYAVTLVRMTRPQEAASPELVKRFVSWGAGPRAIQSLILGAKTWAAMAGRQFVSDDDIGWAAKPVLRHRLVTNYTAEAEGYSTDRIVSELLAGIDPHHTPMDDHEHYSKVLSA